MLCVVDPAKEMLREAATPGGEEGAAGLQGGAGSLGQLDRARALSAVGGHRDECHRLAPSGSGSPGLARAQCPRS